MYTYDIVIVGAGPCGIACALSAADKDKHVAIIEGGSNHTDRFCAVDAGEECRGCKSCNVISGLGGCIHYGDSAKLSYFPSGKELKKKLGEDYDRIRDEACAFWGVDSQKDFISNAIFIRDHDFSVKEYPVCVLGSNAIKQKINDWWQEIQKKQVEYINGEMIDFEKKEDVFIVTLRDNKKLLCKKLVLAMGRKGTKWLRDNVLHKGIDYKAPISSMGLRFEMPKDFLVELGKRHPDFKARVERNKVKFKTFCFCAGIHGGRLKFTNYGDYTLLDGHVLTECDVESDYGNFALLRQVVPSEKTNVDYHHFVDGILKDYYAICAGRPIYQSFINFEKMLDENSSFSISTPCVKEGPVYKLLGENLNEYCDVAQEIFRYIADINGISIEELLSEVNVVGLELEGLWDHIITDEKFMTNIEGLYFGGDCSGEAQGILQATMMGIKISESL